jgi:hypothetical protein
MRIEVNPSQSHWRPVPLAKPSMVFATSSRVLFIGGKTILCVSANGKTKDGCEMRDAGCEMRDAGCGMGDARWGMRDEQKFPLPLGEGGEGLEICAASEVDDADLFALDSRGRCL